MRVYLLVGVFWMLWTQGVKGQVDFEYYDSIPVLWNNSPLPQPWTGGMSHMHFAELDLDFDGVEDLLALDRMGNRAMAFLRKGSGQNFYYTYSYEVSKRIPELRGFVIAADINCDGKKDLFTGNQFAGILLYLNTSTQGQLQFTKNPNGDFLFSQFGTISSTIFNNPLSIPVIADLDGDNRLEVINQSVFEDRFELHRAVQPCTTHFEQIKLCWGGFVKSDLFLSLHLMSCSINNLYEDVILPEKVQHLGAVNAALMDLSGNGRLDMLMSEEDYPTMTAVFNTGTSNINAWMTGQDTAFPSGNPIYLPYSPSPVFIDLDKDGKKDLLLSPRQRTGRMKNSVWYLKNVGTGPAAQFQLQTKSFLQDQSLNLEYAAYPVIADLDGDGKPDLIAGHHGQEIDSALYRGRLYFFKNTGTASMPVFELADTNLANTWGLNAANLYPTLGDIDGDGDLDLIVGLSDGSLVYVENTGTSTNPQWAVPVSNFQNIQVGQWAAPELVDVDGDGKLDLLIGNRLGHILYYKNTGTSTNPVFTLSNQKFGGVDMRGPFDFNGHAMPRHFRLQGRSLLAVGSHTQGIHLFDSLSLISQKPESITQSIGNGSHQLNTADLTPFGISRRTGRNQVLYRAQDIKDAGLVAGRITQLAFNLSLSGNFYISQGISIKMKNTKLSQLQQFDTLGFTEVYNQMLILSTGWNVIPLTTTFLWDGHSDLVIEFCFSQNMPSQDLVITGHDAGFPANAYGNIQGFNTIFANGCAMPYLNTSTLRPDIRITLLPSLYSYGQRLVEGHLNAAALHDFDGDGWPELILGNASGGLQFFKGKVPANLSVPTHESTEVYKGISVFPNPASDIINLLNHAESSEKTLKYAMYSLDGRKVSSGEGVWYGAHFQIDVSQMPAGMYILYLQTADHGAQALKVCIRR
ncbi:FG-GAP-like repeat-containing protein [Schleiferia thermophila]|uniref:Putative secreted protein (Por secretion system target) n=1 Tax=Schleiferia thermophila TaxID=884107 RepID=A0A368ZYW7_9FLAO|nr:FG-GAP-like repeat-containing protein [Schleiferia thermophila]RCX02133.1 putative secreted protein (Por secretion system target) [Schleiferia thermophila]